jgi:hypothetical protein
MTPLLLTLIAHVLADYIFQTNTTVARKNRLQIAGFVTHGLTVFLTLLVLLHCYQPGQILIYGLLITALHLLLDWGKVALVARLNSQQAKLNAFYGDQFLHLVTLLLIWQQFNWRPNPWVSGFYDWLISPRLLAVFGGAPSITAVSGEKALLILLAYLAVCWGGVVFVDQFLSFLKVPGKTLTWSGPLQRTGCYIGMIERGLILTLTLNNSLTAVVFIFTAKSIARFNELNDRSFAEYYLIGTLLSTALAVGGGLVTRFLLQS